MNANVPREEELFAVAIEIPEPARRALYLDQACRDDAALRARVEALLRRHFEREGVLDAPPPGLAATVVPAGITERPGTEIGPYKLLQLLGEGGMGTVFMAEQAEPVKRLVALKIIKAGMDTQQVIARFEAERQALALMDHPNIAKVLDAGMTRSGRSYFVMELVRGAPITRYCDEHRLTPRQRLELFIPVCQAINHAHQKGIIHRDIKPSNVLIAVYDGQPTVKVIDFGVAKAIGPAATQRTLLTNVGGIVGTLQYMSPEQAELDAVDIDTRSDVYGLGVLLYELLTGSTPLTRRQLDQAAVAELLRMIREDTPPRPSMRLADTGDALPSIAAVRHTEPATLTRAVRGDLDWIVMKALEKDRRRRYDSASGFARDIEHYLNREPVEARPPSASYLVRKFVQRNKHLVGMLATIVVALVITIVATASGMITARRAESEERAAKQQARDAATVAQDAQARELQERLKAQASAKAAEQAARDAQAVLQFFERRVLAAARPKGQVGGLGQDVTIRAALAAAEPAIEAEFSKTPVVEASIRNVVGETYTYLGQSALAITHLRRSLQLFQESLGSDHRETLQAQNNLATAYAESGQWNEALPLFEQTLETRRRTLGTDDMDTLQSTTNLAMLYVATNRFSQALPLLQAAVQAYQDQGIIDDQALTARNNLGLALQQTGHTSAALPHYEAVLQERKRILGMEHPNTLASLVNLSSAYRDVGRLAEAVKLAEETREQAVKSLTIEHPFALAAMNNLFVAYSAAARFEEATQVGTETLGLVESRLGPQHPNTQKVRLSLAEVHLRCGRFDAAAQLAELALPHVPPDSPDREEARQILGESWLMTNKTEAAIEILRATQGSATTNDDKSDKPWTSCLLGAALAAAGQFEEAERHLLEGHARLAAATSPLPERHRRTAWLLEELVKLYERWGKPAESARWQQQLDASRHKPAAFTDLHK